jgi:hypothetical protein
MFVILTILGLLVAGAVSKVVNKVRVTDAFNCSTSEIANSTVEPTLDD